MLETEHRLHPIMNSDAPASLDLPAIFAIDDDLDHLQLITELVSAGVAHGRISVALPLHACTDPAEAISALPANRPVVVLLDYQLNDGTAQDWIAEIVRRDVGPVILITSGGSEQVAAQMFKSGVSDYLTKSQLSQTPESLYAAIRQALRRHKLERRNRELTGRLQEINETLERRAEHLKSLTETAHRFVDDVAHEFRNPLTVIQMFASNIEDGLGGPVSDRQREFLGFISNATRDLAQLIDDFLDSSRLKNGLLRVDRKPHQVEEIFASVRAALGARAQQRGIAIREVFPPSLPTTPLVFCDFEKAGRILINLAVNAIKFSPDGAAVEITAAAAPGGIRISVRDRGPGIPPEELDRIRMRFGQARNIATNAKGFGLGLDIAEQLARLNFGALEIESTPCAGSTFSFILCASDPLQITQRFLLSLYEQQPAPTVSVLQASLPDATGSLDAVRSFLAGACFPMDLLLRGTGERSLLLIGDCDRPGDWITRLNAQWKARAPSDTDTPAFHLCCLGTWRRPELDVALPQCVASHLSSRNAPVTDCFPFNSLTSGDPP